MGRSSLQGSPWHEEIHYSKSKNKNGSTQCASNVKGKCICIIAPFYHQPCGGSIKCKEYSYKGNYAKAYNG